MDLPDLTHPDRLLWLLLLPVLYWLALPPRPKHTVLTAHLREWRRALQSVGRRPVRFRRLRFWLLVAAFAAVVAASTGPAVGARPGPRKLAILLDTSASMAATTPSTGPAPWPRAVELLRRTLASLPAEIEVRVALWGSDVRVLGAERTGIEAQLPPSPTGAARAGLAELAARLAGPEQAVLTITDGLGPSEAPTAGALRVLGRPLPNRAIIACRIDDHWPLPEVELELEVRAFGGAAGPFEVTLTGDGEPQLASTSNAPLDDGGVRIRLALTRGLGGAVRVALAQAPGADDALAIDDRVGLWLPPPPAPDVAVLAGPDPSLWLQIAAESLADLGGGTVVDALAVEKAGFLIADGAVFAQPEGRALTFGSALSGTAEVSPGDLLRDPLVVDWDRSHPLTRGLDLSDLRIDRALPARFLPPDGHVLVEGEEGPLLVAVEDPRHRTVHAAFRLADSNLPFLPAFPQLLRRSYVWAYGADAAPRVLPDNLLSASESDLRPSGAAQGDRPLPQLGRDGFPLAVPLLCLAFLALLLRVYA